MTEVVDGLTFVGIDPGTTAAVAVLDLDGELIGCTSQKNFSKNRMISYIVSQGKPLVVAADVAHGPARVEAVAANTGSAFFAPDDDLQSDYKDELAAPFDQTTDTHTRDAIAAAEYARRAYKDKLHEIRRRAAEAGVDDQLEEIVMKVVRDQQPISTAIDAVTPSEPVEEAEKDTEQPEQDWKRIAEQRQQKIDVLQEKIANLEAYNERLQEEQEEDEPGVSEEALRQRNQLIHELRTERDREAAHRERLENENTALRQAVAKLRDDGVYIPLVPSLEEATAAVVAVTTYNGEDISPHVEAVVTEDQNDRLKRQGITVIPLSTIDDVIALESGYVVNETAVHPGETETRTDEFLAWLDEYRQR